MKIEIDTHCHTIVSGHAYNTLREMVSMAAEKGLAGLAVTEHAPQMPGAAPLYYFQNFQVVPRSMCGIHLLLGAEVNITDRTGGLDLPEATLKNLDLAIASMHMPCFLEERTIENVMEAYYAVMQNPYVDIIGHPDDGRFPADYEALAKEAKRTGTLLEVNNSSLRPEGFRVNTHENCKKMLEACKKEGTMIVWGSDAHVDVDAGNFCNVSEILAYCNFPEDLVVTTDLEKLKPYLNCFKSL